MKKCKRLSALFLTVCLVLSMIVPTIYAEETDESTAQLTVEYPLYHSDMNINDGGRTYMVNSDGTANDLQTTMSSLYAAGTTNITYAAYGNGDGSTNRPYMCNNHKNGPYQGLMYWGVVGDWVAFRFKSPGDGEFQIQLNNYYNSNNTKNCDVYILSGDTASDAIGTALDSATVFCSVNLKNNEETSLTLGSKQFHKDQEYVIVFKATAVGSGTNARMHIIGLTMTQIKTDSDDAGTVITGEYPLYNADLQVADGKRVNMATEEAMATLQASYDSKNTNIVFIGSAQSTKETPTMANNYVYVSSSGSQSPFLYQGLMYWCKVGDWVAYKLRSPGAGSYRFSLDYYGNTNNAKELSVYLLPGDTAADAISGAVSEDTLLGTVNMRLAENGAFETATIGGTQLEADTEYVIVLKSTKDCYGKETSNARMHIVGLSVVEGEIEEPEVDPLPEPVSLGEPFGVFAMNRFAASDIVNGDLYYYAPAKGSKMFVYNLSKGTKVAEIDAPWSDPRGCIVDSKGIVYASGSSRTILRYDPYTGEATTLSPVSSAGTDNIYSLVVDENDNLYMGTAKDGRIYKYEAATDTFIDFGVPVEDAFIVPCVAYYNGYLYAVANGNANNDEVTTNVLLKINTNTKEIEATLDLSSVLAEKHPNNLTVVGGNTLFCGDNKNNTMLAVDLDTFQFMDVGITAGGVCGMVSEELNGKAYFVAYNVGLCEYDIATRKATPIEGLESAAIDLKFQKGAIVYLDRPDLPGPSVMTCSGSNGAPVFYNLQTKTVFKWDTLVSGDGTGQNIRSITNGPAGSADIYIGCYGRANATIYNTNADKYTLNFTSGGQTDSLLYYNGMLYAGCYTGANLVQIDPETNTRTTLFNLADYEQTRIHTLAAGDGKIFVGSTPDSAKLGGCIAWYDLETGEIYAERNVVQDQSIHCLVYYDGYLYGTASTSGGSGATPVATEAVIFVYDIANRKKIAEYPVDIEGIENAKFIAGIAADPNNPGTFWGVVSQTLFSFTIDPDTHEVVSFQEAVSYSKTSYNNGGSRQWFPRPIQFGNDGYIYVAFDTAGGMRKINPENPIEDNTRILDVDCPMFYVIGEDNNLYYAIGAEFKTLELNMQVNDAVVAERVRILIDAIGTVNARSKWTIDPAREAYDALTDSQKALVTNYAALTAAETAYAELKAAAEKEAADKAAAEEVTKKIEAIGTVTLSSEEAIKAARAAYEALTADQKTLVDIAKLTAAEAKLAELKTAAEKEAADKASAEAVTAKIDAIGTVTLNSEEAIKAARAAYNALTVEQKALVSNLSVLTAAETALAALQIPQTGDAAPIAAMLSLLVLSAAALSVLAIFDTRKKHI